MVSHKLTINLYFLAIFSIGKKYTLYKYATRKYSRKAPFLAYNLPICLTLTQTQAHLSNANLSK